MKYGSNAIFPRSKDFSGRHMRTFPTIARFQYKRILLTELLAAFLLKTMRGFQTLIQDVQQPFTIQGSSTLRPFSAQCFSDHFWKVCFVWFTGFGLTRKNQQSQIFAKKQGELVLEKFSTHPWWTCMQISRVIFPTYALLLASCGRWKRRKAMLTFYLK